MVNTVGKDHNQTSEAYNKPLEVDTNKVFSHDDLKDWNTEGHLMLVLKG